MIEANVNIGRSEKVTSLFDHVNAYFYLKGMSSDEDEIFYYHYERWIGKVKMEPLSAIGKPLLMIGYRTY